MGRKPRKPPTYREVVFDQLAPGMTIFHKNATHYRILKVTKVKGADPVILATYRIGRRGRYQKEVVQITREHVRGFRVFVPMQLACAVSRLNP